jgi:hypothetical protein
MQEFIDWQPEPDAASGHSDRNPLGSALEQMLDDAGASHPATRIPYGRRSYLSGVALR